MGFILYKTSLSCFRWTIYRFQIFFRSSLQLDLYCNLSLVRLAMTLNWSTNIDLHRGNDISNQRLSLLLFTTMVGTLTLGYSRCITIWKRTWKIIYTSMVQKRGQNYFRKISFFVALTEIDVTEKLANTQEIYVVGCVTWFYSWSRMIEKCIVLMIM